MMCFHGAANLTAALPPEQNDIVCSLSPSLSLFLSPPPLPPPVHACSPSSSLHACWQHKLHSSAVFPHCRSRSCMSSAYLSGMGLLKGNATSRVSVCVCVCVCALILSPPSSPPCTPSANLPPRRHPRESSV